MSVKAQAEFIGALKRMVTYWMKVDLPSSDVPIERQRVEGIVHSFLCIMDGVAGYCDAQTLIDAMEGPDMLHDLFSADERQRNEEKHRQLEPVEAKRPRLVEK